MGLLTTIQAQSLWDNRTKSCKCYVSGTKNAANFASYVFDSALDGQNYHINSSVHDLSVTHSSDAATVEATVKAYLKTLSKTVVVAQSQTDI